MVGQRARAVSAHDVPARAPLRVEPGDYVVAERRDSDWPEFVFVRAAHGQGWVPARFLADDRGNTIVTAEYDTTELAVRAGDQLLIVHRDDQSGWHWCRSTDGQEGWVPARNLGRNDEL